MSECLVVWWGFCGGKGRGRRGPASSGLLVVVAATARPTHQSTDTRPPNNHEQIRNSYKEYGSVFTVNLFTQKMTFLIGPEAAAAFFKVRPWCIVCVFVYIVGRGLLCKAYVVFVVGRCGLHHAKSIQPSHKHPNYFHAHPRHHQFINHSINQRIRPRTRSWARTRCTAS